jgi:hypothetical protein
VWRAANGIHPTTHGQPEQHSCPQLGPSGNTTSTEASLGAATTTSVVLTSQSARLPQPHVIAGTKIDNTRPNHPPSTRIRQPAPAHRSPAKARLEPADRNDGRPPTAEFGSNRSRARRKRLAGGACPPYGPGRAAQRAFGTGRGNSTGRRAVRRSAEPLRPSWRRIRRRARRASHETRAAASRSGPTSRART